MSKPSTILFFGHTAKWSGGEIALFHLVRRLDTSRFRPLVVLASEGVLADRLRAADVETIVLPLSPGVTEARKDALGAGTLGKVRQVLECVGYTRKLAQLIRERDVALVHTNTLKADIIGGAAARLARVPCLWYVRDHINGEYLPGPVARAFQLLARTLPGGIVANSRSTLNSLQLPPGFRATVAYPGIPVEEFAQASATAPLNASTRNIALMGRITPWKGQEVFLRAASQIAPDFPDVRFQLIGSAMFGEEGYERRLQNYVAEAGLGERVQFLGFRDDVAELMAQASVVVHASTMGEPFGKVVVEGMAAAKPVIATDGGALREIVVPGPHGGPAAPGETGLLVPMGDAESMAYALRTLLLHPERAQAMGENGRARVRERFTIEQTVESVQNFYDEFLRGIPRAKRHDVRESRAAGY